MVRLLAAGRTGPEKAGMKNGTKPHLHVSAFESGIAPKPLVKQVGTDDCGFKTKLNGRTSDSARLRVLIRVLISSMQWFEIRGSHYLTNHNTNSSIGLHILVL
jgi:hypothetical protein